MSTTETGVNAKLRAAARALEARAGEPDTYIVICRDDKIGRRKGAYFVATRRVFATAADATAYRKTVNKSRDPLVVAGRWRSLRFDEAGS